MKKTVVTLWIMLIVTSLLVACIGAYLKYEVLKPYGVYQDKSIMELPFLALKTNYFIETALEQQNSNNQHTDPPETSADTKPDATETVAPDPSKPAETTPPVTTEATTEPTTQPTETEPPTIPPDAAVSESWFDDVLFIGDSRTVGMRDYARLGKAEYFCDVGLSVYGVQKNYLSDKNFSSMRLATLLETHSYGKVFIGLGINEAGYPMDSLMGAYKDLVDLVREKQPDAIIILEGIMTVGRAKARSASYFHIDHIFEINDNIASLCDGEHILYVDVNQWIADDDGYLPDSISADGVHLYGTGYSDWAQWFRRAVAQLGFWTEDMA